MKATLRIAAFLLGAFFALFSLLIPASLAQVKKNGMLLADMRDCVHAIKAFEHDTGRLPTDVELGKIEDSVPRRHSLRYGFQFGAPPSQVGQSYPKEPKLGGWMIWYWRGEWSEFYSSWDDHYSLQDQASFWKFVGPLVWAPPLSVLFFCLGFLRILRVRPDQTSVPTTSEANR